MLDAIPSHLYSLRTLTGESEMDTADFNQTAVLNAVKRT